MSRFCWGLGMRLCESCRHNIDNQNNVDERDKPFKPHADPPRCADWAAMPSKAGRDV